MLLPFCGSKNQLLGAGPWKLSDTFRAIEQKNGALFQGKVCELAEIMEAHFQVPVRDCASLSCKDALGVLGTAEKSSRVLSYWCSFWLSLSERLLLSKGRLVRVMLHSPDAVPLW